MNHKKYYCYYIFLRKNKLITLSPVINVTDHKFLLIGTHPVLVYP